MSGHFMWFACLEDDSQEIHDFFSMKSKTKMIKMPSALVVIDALRVKKQLSAVLYK